MSEEVYSHQQLTKFTTAVFEACGMSSTDAELAADVLVTADLRGIDSHGVARLSGYVRLWKAGRANMKPAFRMVRETLSTAVLDADQGLGLVSGPAAMDIAIEKAKTAGTGWVGVQNSNHFGIAAYHAMKALPHDMIGFCMTNASPLVAPTRSKERMLGTNPICMAVPSGSLNPFVLDMATSAAANGKLEIAQRKGVSVPDGWVQTAEGNESTDANELKKGGALLPLGGHKGYGLASLVDILCGVLPGANFGPWVPPFVAFLDPVKGQPGKGIGHFMGAMRIDAFQDASDFKANMDLWIKRFKATTPINPDVPVLIPGEPEQHLHAERLLNGIPLNEMVAADLRKLAEELGLSL